MTPRLKDRSLFDERHYKKIARLLASHTSPPGPPDSSRNSIIDEIVEDFSAMFKDDNPIKEG